MTPAHWWHWLWIVPMVCACSYGLVVIIQDTYQYLDEWRAERRLIKALNNHPRIKALQAAKARENYWNGRGRGHAPRQE